MPDQVKYIPRMDQHLQINKKGIQGMCLNVLKDINDKTTANIILKSEMMKSFPLRAGTRQEIRHVYSALY